MWLFNHLIRTLSNNRGAITFDGVDDLVNCGSAASLDELQSQGGGGMTISAWVYANSSGGGGGYGAIATKYNGTTELGWSFGRADPRQANSIGFGKPYVVTYLLRDTALNTFTDNALHHVLATWDGSNNYNNIHIYIDGTEPSYGTQTNGVLTETTDAAQNLVIGNDDVGSAWDGQITELAIWNVVLTAGNISDLYGNGAPLKGIPTSIQPTALKMYLPMNDGVVGTSADADTVADLSGNVNNGTGDDGANNTGLTWATDPLMYRIPSLLLLGVGG